MLEALCVLLLTGCITATEAPADPPEAEAAAPAQVAVAAEESDASEQQDRDTAVR